MKNWFGILTLVLLLPLTLPAAEIPSQQQEPLGLYNLGRQQLGKVGSIASRYLLPQDRYSLPAYLAAVFATTGLGKQPIGRGMEDLVNYIRGNKTGIYDESQLPVGDQWRLLTYLHIPALWALGHAARKMGNLYNPSIRDQTNYAYYAPGVIAGLSPYALMSLSNALNIPYSALMQKIGFLGMTTGPLLLGAGHLAHQYFNPPVQAPSMPVLPEQIEAVQPQEEHMGEWINMKPEATDGVPRDPFGRPYHAENSPWYWWPDDVMEARYAEFKDAVFAKMGPAFAEAFNLKFPRSSKEAVKELALYIDALTPWSPRFPPTAVATIGAKRIVLEGDIAAIIDNMKINHQNNEELMK